MTAAPLSVLPVPVGREVRAGDDLSALLAEALGAAGVALEAGDVVAVAQKVVSKAEGRLVRIAEVAPSGRAAALGRFLGKDPRKVEVILRESRRVVMAARPEGKPEGVLIVETRHGFVAANGGVDESNAGEAGALVLLPEDPDASAARLRDDLAARLGVRPAVVVTDSFGRPWRLGVVDVAIGVAGMPAAIDLRGTPDADGRTLHGTVVALADQVAAAAGITMRKRDRTPAAVVRGVSWDGAEGRATDLVRPEKEDVFR